MGEGEFINSHMFSTPDLDYQMQAGIFRGGASAGGSRQEEYKPPKEAREGFTRSPEEDDILLCCACDQELGADSESEHGDEVWTGKCGHVSFLFTVLKMLHGKWFVLTEEDILWSMCIELQGETAKRKE